MKLPAIILSFLFSMIAILLVINLTVSNVLSTQGIDLQQLQDNLHTLQVSDTNLEEKTLALGSYTKIASEAATLGFVQDKNPVALTPDQTQPLAYNP